MIRQGGLRTTIPKFTITNLLLLVVVVVLAVRNDAALMSKPNVSRK